MVISPSTSPSPKNGNAKAGDAKHNNGSSAGKSPSMSTTASNSHNNGSSAGSLGR